MTNPIIQFPPISDDIIRRSFTTGFPGCRWLKDSEGRVVWISRNYVEQTGLSADQVMGRTVSEIFGEAVGAELAALDTEAFKTGELVVREVTAPCPGGLKWKQWMLPLPGRRILGSAISLV